MTDLTKLTDMELAETLREALLYPVRREVERAVRAEFRRRAKREEALVRAARAAEQCIIYDERGEALRTALAAYPEAPTDG